MSIVPELSKAEYIGLELAKVLLPALIAILSGLWVAFTYIDGQEQARAKQDKQIQNDNLTRRLEVQKPFSSIQLALFMEAGKAAGQLAAFDKSAEKWRESVEWKGYYTRFYQLFWTELSIVEDEEIKSAMQNFSLQLNAVLHAPGDESLQQQLNQLAYRLARTLRRGIEKTWDVDLGALTDPSKKVDRPAR